VHGDGLADNETILCELSNRLAGVGSGDFGGFIGIEPDLALSTVQDVRREALLRAEVDPTKKIKSVSIVKENDFMRNCSGEAIRTALKMLQVVYGILESKA
jgi:hypothetical protein